MADIDAVIERAGRPMSRLGEPSGAWRMDNAGGAEGLTRRLGAEHLGALDAAVRATAGREATDVTVEDFSAAAIAELMAAVRYDLMAGRGAALLCGIDLSRYDLDEFKRLHFGLGTHLGTASPQSARGDRIGMVRKEPSPERRGYLSDAELGPHTDFHEILSLASVVTSREGGVSGFVSAAAVYGVMRDERPDLVALLERGYPYPTSLSSVTDYAVPSFSVVDGHIALYNYVIFIAQAAEIRGEPVPPALVEALRYMFRVAARPELMTRFTMQPGQIVFWHNFRVMHSRTAFRNEPDRERLLMRLWLRAHESYPMARGFQEIADLLDAQHAQGWSMLVNTDESLKAVYEMIHG